MAIAIRKASDIDKLRVSNQLVAKTLNLLKNNTRLGISLKELNQMGEEFIVSHGGRPAFKGLYGFPSAVCTSVNQVIIHGIPTDYKLQNGDIVGFDVGVELNGWYGDAAITIGIGEISKDNQKLISCSKNTLDFAVSIIKVGMRFKELSFEIEKFIRNCGYVPLADFCGHGIGKKPHEEPNILNYVENGSAKSGPKIKNGMVFCLEPMICQKEMQPVILKDKWSVVSKDGLNTSHHEYAVAVINGKAEILSQI